MIDPVAILAKILSAELQNGNKPELCLILGAGASISSGGETFEQLKARLVARFGMDQETVGADVEGVLESNGVEEFFERLFTVIQSPQTRAKIIRDAFPDRVLPADGYVCVALLCAAGVVRSIVTTNFDGYLESAVRKVGVNEKLHVIYAPSEYDQDLIAAASETATVAYKIHGDRHLGVHNITADELNSGEYPDNVRQIAVNLIARNRILVSGYSGAERRMAALFLSNPARNQPEVFWFDPMPLAAGKPLFDAVSERLVQSGREDDALRFDPAMMRLLGSLDSEWFSGRTGLFRAHSMYGSDVERHTADTLRVQEYLSPDDPLYVRRPRLLVQIHDAIDAGDKLVAIVGPSGYGKSTLMPALIDELTDQSRPTTILLSVGGDLRAQLGFEQHLADVFGLSQLLGPSLVLMNSDLRQSNRRLVIILDAIDQARSSIDEIKLLFRDIASFQAKCVGDGIDRISFVISCRSEIWQAMSAPTNRYRVDISSTREIFVDRYDDNEAEAAFRAYTRHHRVSGEFHEINPESRMMMREPILLRIICKAYEGVRLPETLELHRVFDSFLQACFEGHRDYNALAFLETLAIKWLDPRIARDGAGFGDLPSGQDTLGDNIDVALRAGIIRRTFQGSAETYVFFHERVLELFMTRYLLREYEGPLKNIRFTHDDLVEGLEHAADSKHAANVFKMFLTSPRSQRALGNCLVGADEQTEMFLADCVIETSQVNPEAFAERFIDWFVHARRERIRAVLIQSAANSVQARGHLWEVLDRLEDHETNLFVTASYYLLDNVAVRLEKVGAELLASTPLSQLIHYVPGRELRTIGFVLYLLARCAPERSDESSWRALYTAARDLLRQLAASIQAPSEGDFRVLAERFAPRYVFNGSTELFKRFFQKGASNRAALLELIEALTTGTETLSPQILDSMLSCADESEAWFEKILLQPLLAYVAHIDVDRYREIILAMLARARNASQADLCSGSVAYQVAANDYFDHEFSYRVNAYCIDKRPDFLALERAYSELFNPIGTYGLTYPRYHPGKPVDLFEIALIKFRKSGDDLLVGRVLHALRQTLALYPEEGLATLEAAIDHQGEVVRERLIMVLSEGYMVEPDLVSRFVWRHEDVFTADERRRMLRGTNASIHVHPITILEWGRVFRFLLAMNSDARQWRNALLQIAQARSFSDLFQAFVALAVGRQTKKP